ncbi:HTTM domain-containing protein, partial [Halobacteriales archaeon SW_12_71_31]
LGDRPLTFDRPPDLADAYPTHRWMRYLLNLRAPDNAELRPAFADHLCRRWERRHDAALEDVTVYFMAEPTDLDGPESVRRERLHAQACP